MKAIVHIGAPKTGTTSIQVFLRENRAALTTRGFTYRGPTRDRTSQYEYALAALERLDRLVEGHDPGHLYAITDRAAQAQAAAPAFAALAEDARAGGTDTAIISSEHIQPWLRKRDEIGALDDLLHAHYDDVRYVLYLREPGRYAVSLYSQCIQNGAAIGFDGFFKRALSGLGFDRVVERWARVVGDAALEVRLMDPGRLQGGSLIADFCAGIGTASEGLVSPAPENPGLTAVGLDCVAAVNRAASGTDRQALIAEIASRTAGEQPLGLLPYQAKALDTALSGSLEKLRAMRFPGLDTLFTVPAPTMTWDELMAARDRARDILADLLVDARRLSRPGQAIVALRGTARAALKTKLPPRAGLMKTK